MKHLNNFSPKSQIKSPFFLNLAFHTICNAKYCLLILLGNVALPFNLVSQVKVQNLYIRYDAAKNQCGDCMITSTGYEIDKYNTALKTIASDIKDNSASFLEKALKVKVYQDMLQIASVKADMGRDNLEILKTRIGVLIEWNRRFSDEGKSYSEYEKEIAAVKKNRKVIIKILFGEGNSGKNEFSKVVWQSLKRVNDSLIIEKENQIYKKFIVKPDFNTLDTFLQKFCAYDDEGKFYSHHGKTAFYKLYHILTAEGEGSSFDLFKQFVLRRNGPEHFSSVWKKLFEDEPFQKMFNDDRDQARKWEDVIYSNSATEEEISRVINEAAPREIAFVALQKIIRPYLDSIDFKGAHKLIKEHNKAFSNQSDIPSAKWKVDKLSGIIDKLEKQPKGELSPVISTESNDIGFFLDKNKSYLGVMPVGDGSIRIYRVGKKSPFEETSVEPSILSYSNVYWFENKGTESTGVIEAQDQYLFYKIDKDSIINASDFFLSKDAKVLVFAGISKFPQYDRLNDQACPYPGSGIFFNQFQEFGHNNRFHGKGIGNPNTDIFICNKIGERWSRPRLLRGNVNTPFSERSPVLSDDNRTLYFASEGHPGIGGFDIFKIHLDHNFGSLNDPENIIGVCPDAISTDDDVFFNPVRSTKEGTLAFFSSNRGEADFNIFQALRKANTPTVSQPKPPQIPSPGASASAKPPIPSFGKFNLTVNCEEVKQPAPGLPEGYVIVSGQVLDEDYKPVENATVTFYAHDDNPITDRNNEGANYSCWVPYGPKEFKVVVTGFTKDGTKITHRSEEMIEVCNNERGTTNTKKDFVTTKINDVELRGEELRLPFFFGSGKYNYTLSDEKMLINYYSTTKNSYKDRPIRLICYGFADITGSDVDNLKLSQKRADFVKEYLIANAGFKEYEVKAIGVGETDAHSKDNFEKHLREMTYPIKNINDYQRQLLLNRRVVVRFTDKFK